MLSLLITSASISIQPTISPSPLRPPPLCSSPAAVAPASMASSARIAVVGDVHGFWDLEEDTKALRLLQPDLVLFTGRFSYSSAGFALKTAMTLLVSPSFKQPLDIGDFANEDVEIVQSIANLEFTKAVILGNHDAWKTQHFSTKKKDRVQLQLEWCLDFPSLKLSIVGGRPFSIGGDKLFRDKLLSARFGVQDMEQSARRIYNVALCAPEDHLVIILAHNGPTGLGSNPNDICGKDWIFGGGGDHGDPDLAKAISRLKDSAKVDIPLVVFGHMHKELAHRAGVRKMLVVGTDDIMYLNGAIVPRVKGMAHEQVTTERSPTAGVTLPSSPERRGTLRAFTLVEILDGGVDKVAETWVSVSGEVTNVELEEVLFKRVT